MLWSCTSPAPSAPPAPASVTEPDRSPGDEAKAAAAPAPDAGGPLVQTPAPATIPAPPDVAAPPADAKVEKSGLASKVLRPGNGVNRPGPNDRVEVHYTGWTTDGQMFDSSVARGMSTRFPLNRVIQGWTEGVQLMSVGEKRRLWIPEALAYKGQPGAPAGTLVFDVELLSIEPGPPEISAPPDVAAPPKKARRQKSGLASLVLAKGKGKRRPTVNDTVHVNYSGWTADGKLFDSTTMHGQAARFPLRALIPGWQEGLQLMVEGEKRRMWIPADLAYGEQPKRAGDPAGMLVFDVELIQIE